MNMDDLYIENRNTDFNCTELQTENGKLINILLISKIVYLDNNSKFQYYFVTKLHSLFNRIFTIF